MKLYHNMILPSFNKCIQVHNAKAKNENNNLAILEIHLYSRSNSSFSSTQQREHIHIITGLNQMSWLTSIYQPLLRRSSGELSTRNMVPVTEKLLHIIFQGVSHNAMMLKFPFFYTKINNIQLIYVTVANISSCKYHC